MGVGDAFYGLVQLLRERGIRIFETWSEVGSQLIACAEEARTRIDLTIGFVAEQPLRGVSDPDDELVARRYYDVGPPFWFCRFAAINC